MTPKVEKRVVETQEATTMLTNDRSSKIHVSTKAEHRSQHRLKGKEYLGENQGWEGSHQPLKGAATTSSHKVFPRRDV